MAKISAKDPTQSEIIQVARLQGRRSPALAERRRLYQVYARLEKARGDLVEERRMARRLRRLDEVQFLTESIYHLARSIAHLQLVSKRRYNTDLEALASYK